MDKSMNDNQRKIVEENLELIDKVICKCILVNNHIFGMEYDDICQIGAIGLCKAAMYYCPRSTAAFGTYAFRVIRNTIYDYLRSLHLKQEGFQSVFTDDDYMAQQNCELPEKCLCENDILRALGETKERYSGTTRKGIEAIEMKMQGYTGKDIAEKYSVNTNYISACISRAQKNLKKDDAFLRRIA